jgi:hypothetical protein
MRSLSSAPVAQFAPPFPTGWAKLGTMGTIKTISGGLVGWLMRYFGWLLLISLVTLGGATVLMVVKDWTLKSVFTSIMVWPALALAMLAGVPIAFLRVGRIFLYSAVGGGLLYNLILLFS